MKEVLAKDLKLEKLIEVIKKIREEEIEMQKIETTENATPIAGVGIQRVSMKTDLIPPERMRALLMKSAKTRILSETCTLVCTDCWDYLEMMAVKDLPDWPECPKCGSKALGLLKVVEDKVLPLIEKKDKELTKIEKKIQRKALQTAYLIEEYGKMAVMTLCAKRIQPTEALKILQKEAKLSEKFYELILEAERKALSKRFW